MLNYKWVRTIIFSGIVLVFLFTGTPSYSYALGYFREGQLGMSKNASPASFHSVGEVITYTYVVTNNGTAPMQNVSITDSPLDGGVSCPATSLPPGGSMTCTGKHTITQQDINNGSLTNHASAHAAVANQGCGCGCSETSEIANASATVTYAAPPTPTPIPTSTPTNVPPVSQFILPGPILTGKVTYCEPKTATMNFELTPGTDLNVLGSMLGDGSVFVGIGEATASCLIPGSTSTVMSCTPGGKVTFPAQVKVLSGELVLADFQFSGYECLEHARPSGGGDEPPAPSGGSQPVVPPICPPSAAGWCK